MTNCACRRRRGMAKAFLTAMPRALLLLPLLVLLILILTTLTTSPLSLLHVCIFGTQSNVYCFSAGTSNGVPHPYVAATLPNQRNAENGSNSSVETQPVPALPAPNEANSNAPNDERSAQKNSDDARDAEIAAALGSLATIMRELRGSALPPNRRVDTSTCEGRRVFVYNLPEKFNAELVRQCQRMPPWMDLCTYFTNGGMGEPIKGFHKRWYKTHQYALELIFHARILRYPCRTSDSERANLFYVPFYAGLDILRWHFSNNATNAQRDGLGKELVAWLGARKPWQRRGGSDHFFVLGKISWDFRRMGNEFHWGSNFLSLAELQAPMKLLIEREPWQPSEVAVPHPTFFHPRSDADIRAWQSVIERCERPYLVGFAAAPRPGSSDSIREELISQCRAKKSVCKFLNCTSGACFEPQNTVKLFMSSEFCLQPSGDSPTRRSVFDSLVAGCIPVLFDPFTAYYQYAWHLPANDSAYSVFVPKDSVKRDGADVIGILEKVPAEQRAEMRRKIIRNMMPGLVYGDPDAQFQEFQDAFQISLNNLLWRLRSSAVNSASASVSSVSGSSS